MFLEATSAAATKKIHQHGGKDGCKEVLSSQMEGLFHFALHNLQVWMATNSQSRLYE